jgi:ethanolamine utilization protein EutN
MYLAHVFGSVVSTIKHPFFAGRKLMLVERLGLDGAAEARYDIAVDLVQAGPGDLVLVLDEGSSARQLLDAEPDGPVRAVIVGIVDAVDLAEVA